MTEQMGRRSTDLPERLDTEIKRLDQLRNADQRAVEAALAAAKEAVAAALAASEKAVNKAEVAQQHVNEGQNEFRATLKDQAATLMPRGETENLIRELRGLISGQGDVIVELRSRLDIGPPSLGVLQARSDQAVGHDAGALDTRTLLFALIGVAGVVLAAIAFFAK
jgi:methylase of polypeptide subunit release factors